MNGELSVNISERRRGLEGRFMFLTVHGTACDVSERPSDAEESNLLRGLSPGGEGEISPFSEISPFPRELGAALGRKSGEGRSGPGRSPEEEGGCWKSGGDSQPSCRSYGNKDFFPWDPEHQMFLTPESPNFLKSKMRGKSPPCADRGGRWEIYLPHPAHRKSIKWLPCSNSIFCVLAKHGFKIFQSFKILFSFKEKGRWFLPQGSGLIKKPSQYEMWFAGW